MTVKDGGKAKGVRCSIVSEKPNDPQDKPAGFMKTNIHFGGVQREVSKNLFIIMGVAGSGKTTVGKKLAAAWGVPFFDADDFHSEENRKKMQTGVPLVDGDRAPWLRKLNQLLRQQSGKAVLACSALKAQYREVLQSELVDGIQWIYLEGDRDLIAQRLALRTGHYMAPDMLPSQFRILEPPADAWTFNVRHSVDEIVQSILESC